MELRKIFAIISLFLVLTSLVAVAKEVEDDGTSANTNFVPSIKIESGSGQVVEGTATTTIKARATDSTGVSKITFLIQSSTGGTISIKTEACSNTKTCTKSVSLPVPEAGEYKIMVFAFDSNSVQSSLDTKPLIVKAKTATSGTQGQVSTTERVALPGVKIIGKPVLLDMPFTLSDKSGRQFAATFFISSSADGSESHPLLSIIVDEFILDKSTVPHSVSGAKLSIRYPDLDFHKNVAVGDKITVVDDYEIHVTAIGQNPTRPTIDLKITSTSKKNPGYLFLSDITAAAAKLNVMGYPFNTRIDIYRDNELVYNNKPCTKNKCQLPLVSFNKYTSKTLTVVVYDSNYNPIDVKKFGAITGSTESEQRRGNVRRTSTSIRRSGEQP